MLDPLAKFFWHLGQTGRQFWILFSYNPSAQAETISFSLGKQKGYTWHLPWRAHRKVTGLVSGMPERKKHHGLWKGAEDVESKDFYPAPATSLLHELGMRLEPSASVPLSLEGCIHGAHKAQGCYEATWHEQIHCKISSIMQISVVIFLNKEGVSMVLQMHRPVGDRNCSSFSEDAQEGHSLQ